MSSLGRHVLTRKLPCDLISHEVKPGNLFPLLAPVKGDSQYILPAPYPGRGTVASPLINYKRVVDPPSSWDHIYTNFLRGEEFEHQGRQRVMISTFSLGSDSENFISVVGIHLY